MSTAAWLTAAFHAGLCAVLLRRLDPLHPAVLWTAPFAVTTTLFALDLLPYRDLSGGTAALLCATTGLFVAGTVAGGRAARRRDPAAEHAPASRRTVPVAAALGLGVLVVWLWAFLAETIAAYGWRAVLVTSPEVRQDLQAGTATLTIKYVYATSAAAGLCALAAAQAATRRARAGWLAGAALAALSAYFSTGRSNVILPLLVAAVAFGAATGRRLPLRRAAVAGAAGVLVVLAVFTVGGSLIGKTLDNAPLGRVDSAFTGRPALEPLALPYQYATAPLAALDVQVRAGGRIPRTDGCATFSVVCQVASAAGFDWEAVPRIRPFTAEPLPWNTYTALDLPLLDGGPAGALLFFLAAGLVAGALAAHARPGRPMPLFAYGLAGSAILFAPIQNNFFAPHVLGALLIGLALLAAAPAATRLAPYFRRVPVGPSSLRSR